VLSGTDDVFVYSIGGGNGNGKDSPLDKNVPASKLCLFTPDGILSISVSGAN
jgi:hypothetical protein